jgi:hypothetical protein
VSATRRCIKRWTGGTLNIQGKRKYQPAIQWTAGELAFHRQQDALDQGAGDTDDPGVPGASLLVPQEDMAPACRAWRGSRSVSRSPDGCRSDSSRCRTRHRPSPVRCGLLRSSPRSPRENSHNGSTARPRASAKLALLLQVDDRRPFQPVPPRHGSPVCAGLG